MGQLGAELPSMGKLQFLYISATYILAGQQRANAALREALAICTLRVYIIINKYIY